MIILMCKFVSALGFLLGGCVSEIKITIIFTIIVDSFEYCIIYLCLSFIWRCCVGGEGEGEGHAQDLNVLTFL